MQGQPRRTTAQRSGQSAHRYPKRVNAGAVRQIDANDNQVEQWKD